MRPTHCQRCGLLFDADQRACLCPNGTQQWREINLDLPEWSDPPPTTAQDIVDHKDLMGRPPDNLVYISQGPLPPEYHNEGGT